MNQFEHNIIGTVVKGLVDPATLDLEEKHFSCRFGKSVWRGIKKLVSQNKNADVITLSDFMEKQEGQNVTFAGESWLFTLGNIAKDAVSASSAPNHALQIKNEWKARSVRSLGLEMAECSDIDINHYIRELMTLNVTNKNYLHSFADAADEALIEIEKVMSGERVAISTGLSEIDQAMGGLHKSDLIIVAARSAMGKTAFLLNMAAANKNSPLVISGEQSKVQAAMRLFSIYGNVPNHLMRTGNIRDYEFGLISNAIRIINESDGYIYDKAGPTISEVEAVARQAYQDYGCTAIYIDYLQKIKHENHALPKHEQVGEITMRLKDLARELDIPIVALAQVNRRVEQRDNKRPKMGDIKDSGTIEQEADSILTLYRDEVYNEDTSDRGVCEVTFEKNRHGGTGMKRVKWIAPTMRFMDLNG